MEEFIRAFEKQFEDVKPGSLSAETNFRELPEWSSMQALMIMVFLDTDYGVNITAEEMKSTTTIAGLYAIVSDPARKSG